MRRSFALVFFLLFSALVTAQDQSKVDSLAADLASRPIGDTSRIWTLHHLCRAAQWVDLPLAKRYARQSVEESMALNYPAGMASGYQLLGSSSDYMDQLDSALFYYQKATAIYEENDQDYLMGIIYFNTANVHYKRGVYDSSRYFLALADERFQEPELLSQRSGVNEFIAMIHRESGEYEAAIIAATKAYDLALEADDKARIITSQMEVAFSNVALGRHEEALKSHRRGLKIAREAGIDYYIANLHLNVAEELKFLGQLDSARVYVEKGLGLILANPSFADLEADGLLILGDIHMTDKRYEAAEKQFARAEELLRAPDFRNKRGTTLGYLAEAQFQLEKLTAAKKSTLEALSLTDSIGQRSKLMHNYERLARINEYEGNYQQAYKYLRQTNMLNDSLNQQVLSEKVAELTLLFEKERQDRLISEQQSQLALLESDARADRLQRNGLIAGLVGLLVLLAAGWYSFRQRNLRLNTEREQLTTELKGHQRELSAHALQMAQKGQLLDQLGEELRQIKAERPDDRKKLDSLLRELGSEERINQDWANFRNYFQGVHGNFEDRLKTAAEQPLSPRELRLAALIKMQLNNQEVGAILGVSQDSLYKAKYRLRKKLPQATEGELDGFIREL